MGKLKRLEWDSGPVYVEQMETAETHKKWLGTSLVAKWLRIRLPMQGTRVRSLVPEDPTCRGAAEPVHHNY